MDPFTIFALLGTAAQVVGTGVQIYGAQQASMASQRAEELRKKQMNLDAVRQKRLIVRNALKARAMALVAANAQGAESGSGLAGGLGEIGGNAAKQITGVSQGQQIGSQMFDINSQIAGAESMVSFGSGLSTLGGTFAGNADLFSRVTNNFLRQG